MGVAEAIVICIDNSKAMLASNNYKAQLNIIKRYCKAKLDANPESKVTLFIMGSPQLRLVLYPPTSDLQKISDCLTNIHLDPGRLRFREAAMLVRPCLKMLVRTCLKSSSANKQKRVLFFAGGLTDLGNIDAVNYGKVLKELCIAVDVVNFHLEEQDPEYRGLNRFGRLQLDAFVTAVNRNHNSHIVHVEARDSIREVLSKLQATGTADDKHACPQSEQI